MSLRRGLALVSLVSAGTVVVLVLVIAAQYLFTTSAQRSLFDVLAPAADDSAELVLTQTRASDALNDYIVTGDDQALAAFGSSMAQADELLGRLDSIIGTDLPDLDALFAAARKSQAEWLRVDAEPSTTLMADDKRLRAGRQTTSQESDSAYADMISASSDLNRAIDVTRSDAVAGVASFTTQLGVTLIVVGIVIAVGLAALLLAMRRWVLQPLALLRRDLRTAAKSPTHEQPIADHGPVEIVAVARDAESLRRELVAEIDEAKAARQALIQDAPLVAAMRSELRGPDDYETDFATLAGTSEAAEGVLSGDWWDVIPRPTGSFVLVIADASGHGPEASVSALRVRTVLRSALAEGLALDTAAVMGARACENDDHFVTCLMLEFSADRVIHWVNAGHHPAVLVTADKQAGLLSTTGPLLSSLGGSWTIESRQLNPGDLLIAHTDGLVESRAVDGTEWGLSDLQTFLRGLDGHVREDPAEVMSRVLAFARNRAVEWRRDDVTVVAVTLT